MVTYYFRVSAILLAFCTATIAMQNVALSDACADDAYIESRNQAVLDNEFEVFWSNIDLKNSKCLLDKYYYKAMPIVYGFVDEDICLAVYFLEKALEENYKNNDSKVLFEANRKSLMYLLQIIYDGEYYAISALEGNHRSILRQQMTRVDILKGGLFSDAATKEKKIKYAKDTLSVLKSIPSLGNIEIDNAKNFLENYLKEESSEIQPATIVPREVICTPARKPE